MENASTYLPYVVVLETLCLPFCYYCGLNEISAVNEYVMCRWNVLCVLIKLPLKRSGAVNYVPCEADCCACAEINHIE